MKRKPKNCQRRKILMVVWPSLYVAIDTVWIWRWKAKTRVKGKTKTIQILQSIVNVHSAKRGGIYWVAAILDCNYSNYQRKKNPKNQLKQVCTWRLNMMIKPKQLIKYLKGWIWRGGLFLGIPLPLWGRWEVSTIYAG